MGLNGKIWMLCNPISGHGRGLSLFKEAKELFPDIELRLIEGPKHATSLVEEAIRERCDRIVVAGGDGTLNLCAGPLIGKSVPLGIIPLGSGNGYARSLGLPQDKHKALELALTGNATAMDVCFLNEHHFLGVAGIGFDAAVAKEFDSSTGRGAFRYLTITLKELWRAKSLSIDLETSNDNYSGDAFFLCFANTTEFGNGMRISPASLPNDGLAELQVVQKPPAHRLARALYDIYRGNALRNRHLKSIITNGAKVRQSGTIAHVDGEPIEIGHNIEFRLEKGAIWVITDPEL